VATLRLTLFFPDTIPERFKGDRVYQQLQKDFPTGESNTK
jgi:hypothetical protein